jgi:hypothetical protein
VKLDVKKLAQYDEINCIKTCGGRYTFRAKKGEKMVVVVNGKEFIFEDVLPPILTKSHFAMAGREEGDKWVIIIDGYRSHPFEKIVYLNLDDTYYSIVVQIEGHEMKLQGKLTELLKVLSGNRKIKVKKI